MYRREGPRQRSSGFRLIVRAVSAVTFAVMFIQEIGAVGGAVVFVGLILVIGRYIEKYEMKQRQLTGSQPEPSVHDHTPK